MCRRQIAYVLVVDLLWSHLGAAQEALTDQQHRIEQAGTVLMFAIPAAALLATSMIDPGDGTAQSVYGGTHWLRMGGTPRHDLALALSRTAVTTAALKYAVDETRPNGGSYSFPSGHTSIAFTGAEFFRKEYGWKWGAPAYAAAGFVGWSRVEADKHYWHDVIAGAAIGIFANHDFWQRDTPVGHLSISTAAISSMGASAPGLQLQLVH